MGYYRELHRDCWRRTWSFTDRNGLVPGATLAIVSALVGYFAFDEGIQGKVILSLVLAVVVFMTTMYVWNFVSGPPRLARDALAGYTTDVTARDNRIGQLELDVAELKRKPIPMLRFLEGRQDPVVLMMAGNPPIFQPFAWGAVSNCKSLPDKGAVAKSARIELTYESLDGDVLFGPTPGRWRDAPPPAALSPYQLHTNTEPIDLDPTEVTYEFDLATKETLEAGRWYGITAKQWIKPIDEQEARIRVVIRGLNFADVEASYLISTKPGLGFKVELEN